MIDAEGFLDLFALQLPAEQFDRVLAIVDEAFARHEARLVAALAANEAATSKLRELTPEGHA
jgi:hypothetical protein